MSNLCAHCRQPLEPETPEDVERRHAELQTTWGVPESACEVVCEDCWQKFIAADPKLARAVDTGTRHEDYT